MPLELDAHGYRRHGSTRLWLRADSDTDPSTFAYNDGDEHENWVAAAVRDATDVSTFSKELHSRITDWPSLYHLSDRRANLVRPLLSGITGPVLEVGAGMGAITRALGESGADVVAVEGSVRRATVCADRVRDLDNVQVVADTIQGFGRPRRFGTIVMIGVLEYSRRFGFEADGRDPVDVMLEHLVSLLEPNGTLVLAIENQLGLKYLAGFPEDHLGRRMIGVEDRYTDDGVVTFGRQELGRRLAAAGLVHHDWYFPFPDYKVPTTVLAEAALDPANDFDPTPLVVSTAHADPQEPAVTTFEVGQAWAPMIRNGLLPELTNSFLVRASAAELTVGPELAWYYGASFRRPEFSKSTVFRIRDGEVEVERVPSRPDLPHRVDTVSMVLEDEHYSLGETVGTELVQLLRTEGWTVDGLSAWFGEWLAAFRAEAGVHSDAGADAVVPGRLIDALPRNLVRTPEGGHRFIDLEWESTEDLPLGFAVFRALYDTFASQHGVAAPAQGTPLELRELITSIAAAHRLPLSRAVLEAFWDRERAFQSTVIGGPVRTTANEALGARLPVRTEIDTVIADHEQLPTLRADFEAQLTAVRDHNAELDADREAAHAATAQAQADLAAANRTPAAPAPATSPSESVVNVAASSVRAGRRVLGRARRALRRVAGSAPAPQPTEPDTGDLDVDYYRRRYSDVAGHDDGAVRAHWLAYGRAEGRSGRPLIDTARRVDRDEDPARERVLVLMPDAEATDTAAQAWNLLRELSERYNVVAVLLSGGPLRDTIEATASTTVTFDGTGSWYAEDATLVAEDLHHRFAPVYAVAVSAFTHPLVASLERAGTPVIGVISELASTVRPRGILADTVVWASELIFPSQVVASSMQREYVDLKARPTRLLAPGPATLPADLAARAVRVTPLTEGGVEDDLPERDAAEFLTALDPGAILVLGSGAIEPRSGTEYFVRTAAEARRLAPQAPLHFAWTGDREDTHQWYLDHVREAMRSAGLSDQVTFLAPQIDPGALIERSDLFLLTARASATANTAVRAAVAGVPVIAFAENSGVAEWLESQSGLRDLVIPGLDSAAAAATVVQLATDRRARQALSEELAVAAAAHFDQRRFVAELDSFGAETARRRSQLRRDQDTILAAGGIDPDLYVYTGHEDDSAEELVTDYLRRAKAAEPLARPRSGILVRRPVPGFHPLVYAERAPQYDESTDGDAFAHWLRSGRPAGPWSREIVRPADPPIEHASAAQVLVHGHFHYPELLEDLLTRLRANRQPYHLLITTGSEAHRAVIEQRLAEEPGTWEVEVVPNRGRDLAPLFTAVGRRLLDYDLFLHVHSKKSPHAAGDGGDRWRHFLFEHLIGDSFAMMDTICARFAADDRLGLVSPEDPNLHDWDLNREWGEQWAQRFNVDGPLPTHFDFPLGAMFWARTEALRPIIEADLAWEDYPAEPLPVDGSALHALERIIPFVVEQRGYSFLKSVVPGVHR